MLKLLFQRSKALTLALGIVAGVSLALVAGTTSATPIISGLQKTGTTALTQIVVPKDVRRRS